MAEIHYLPAAIRAAERDAAVRAWLPYETAAMAIVLAAASGSVLAASAALAWPLVRARI